ncbi:mitochondrial 54S ribosomal protein bL9m MRPL50 KNAG_0D00480 [Huiozyma naganishii CBS 8797]|uniref:Ribosomal protein L9 domain-containing protein n=1 Tax=Huiozyma naganishii (strain ATCC MYA-139 / BCRC 22969 / CBS 8797 / KCTC 17520 / NBRC 10181 / NCYC 3082 / Yp74L-3) TaxID=1071383 RepID=J7R4M8_HUIN7|nr:hypothetical protein KNAG_0D00480 [Kazachstania naganishii CBS 8797]CCK69800.1 hypothetical protein KNAG_0D00480 [Kazachstania naganishii CBS 8797]
MFRQTGVCLSAVTKRTKRVSVQLLADFPRLQLYRGQVAKVRPALMINTLHRHNGARYVLSESDVDVLLARQYRDRQTLLRARHEKAERESRDKLEREKVAARLQESDKNKKTGSSSTGVLDSPVTVKDIRIPGLDL